MNVETYMTQSWNSPPSMSIRLNSNVRDFWSVDVECNWWKMSSMVFNTAFTYSSGEQLLKYSNCRHIMDLLRRKCFLCRPVNFSSVDETHCWLEDSQGVFQTPITLTVLFPLCRTDWRIRNYERCPSYRIFALLRRWSDFLWPLRRNWQKSCVLISGTWTTAYDQRVLVCGANNMVET